MKSLTETYTPLIKTLRDLNQDLRRRHSYMPSYTEQEMRNLEAWLVEVGQLVQDLDNLSSIIYQHSNLLKIELDQRLKEVISKG